VALHLLLPPRGLDAETRIAGTRELNEPLRVPFERLGGLRQIEPLAEHRMLDERRNLRTQALVMFMRRAHEHALPRFTLRRQKHLMPAVEHDRASAEPWFQLKRRVIEHGFSEPLQRVLRLHLLR